VLLSDRDLLTGIDNKRLAVEPFDLEMIQPSSINVRLDCMLRVFENHKCPHSDPGIEQEDLTRGSDARSGDSFGHAA
jgi:dCTP deaminase